MSEGKEIKIKTVCHACGGKGLIAVMRAAMALRPPVATGEAPEVQRCKICKGTGRLEGVVPPM